MSDPKITVLKSVRMYWMNQCRPFVQTRGGWECFRTGTAFERCYAKSQHASLHTYRTSALALPESCLCQAWGGSWDFSQAPLRQQIWDYFNKFGAQVRPNPVTWKLFAFTTMIHGVCGAQSSILTVCVL